MNKPVQLLICPLFFRDRKRSWASRESKFRLPGEAVSLVVSAWLNSGLSSANGARTPREKAKTRTNIDFIVIWSVTED